MENTKQSSTLWHTHQYHAAERIAKGRKKEARHEDDKKKEQNTPITTVKTTTPCGRHRLKKKGHRRWPTATFSETQVRHKSLTSWCINTIF